MRRDGGGTNTLGGVLQDRRQDLGVGDGFTGEQCRSLHFRVSPNQPDGVKGERSRDRADDRGVAGKNVVEPVIGRGAAEVGGFGRVQRQQSSGGPEDGSSGNPALPLRQSGRKRPNPFLITDNIRKQEFPRDRPIDCREWLWDWRRGRGLRRGACWRTGGWCLIRSGSLARYL